MSLFKRAHVRGMVHEMTRQGIVTWPTKLAEDEAADGLAEALAGQTLGRGDRSVAGSGVSNLFGRGRLFTGTFRHRLRRGRKLVWL